VVPSNALSPCHGWFISHYFYRHVTTPAAQRKDHLIVVMTMVWPEPFAAQTTMF
jgi:hypothetical protein